MCCKSFECHIRECVKISTYLNWVYVVYMLYYFHRLMLDLNIPLVPEYEDLVFYRLPILSKSLEVTVSFIESYNIFYVNLVQHENIIQNWLDKMYEFYTNNG